MTGLPFPGELCRATARIGKRADRTPASDPAVPIAESVTPDWIFSLETGRRFKTLEWHVRSLGLTPTGYRRRWGLPKDYPMAAPNYAAFRSGIGKALGRRGLAPIKD